jgi:hypothetical protein
MGGDAPCPTLKSTRRLKACVGLVDAPESFHGQFLGRRRIAHDAQNPSVNLTLMLAEERLEGIQIALPKLIQDAARVIPHPLVPFRPAGIISPAAGQ